MDGDTFLRPNSNESATNRYTKTTPKIGSKHVPRTPLQSKKFGWSSFQVDFVDSQTNVDTTNSNTINTRNSDVTTQKTAKTLKSIYNLTGPLKPMIKFKNH